MMPHHVTDRTPVSPASASPVPAMAAAPYTKPQITMYGAKYHVVQMPSERQPSKIVRPVDSE